jgi:glycosyltransferase involved in cell wall biosynthesis
LVPAIIDRGLVSAAPPDNRSDAFAAPQAPAEPTWLADVKKTIWLIRPDLRALCQGNLDRFDCWLLVNGAAEYGALAEAEPPLSANLFTEPAEGALCEVRPTLTRFMRLLWETRPDLQACFDLSNSAGQQAFGWWLLTTGANDSPVLARAGLAACRDLLSAPADEALPGVRPTLTRFMTLVRAMRPDLQAAFALDQTDGQQSFVWWFFTHGAAECGLARYFTDEQRRFLNQPQPDMIYGEPIPISRLMARVWSCRPDLHSEFPLDTASGRAAFVSWYFTKGAAEFGLAEAVDEAQARALLAPEAPSALMPKEGQDTSVGAATPARQRHFLPFGVNLIGHARGQFGIGEDVRMAALAMHAAGIPFSIYNVEPGREMCQGDHSVEALISERLPYAVNMLCTTGIETARLAAVKGSAVFDGRRTIGYWPWELPEWPREWFHAYDLVDEVWASSRYTYQAYARSSPKRVRRMPMAVAVEPTVGLGRNHFGLPDDRFLFVFSFDVLSGLVRKNPEACIRAFRTAFPGGHEPTGLVIKAMRATPDNPHWAEMLQAAGEDRRITIINRTLTRAEVLDLYRCCDCFLSLHRAEGFGRGIAEAMLLGKPVIVTGYSGNMDFTTLGTAALVDHRLQPVGPGEYPFGDGQLWAQPDVDHAAWWMRLLTADRQTRDQLSSMGQQLTAMTYAPAAVGGGYVALLNDSVPAEAGK